MSGRSAGAGGGPSTSGEICKTETSRQPRAGRNVWIRRNQGRQARYLAEADELVDALHHRIAATRPDAPA